jgi:hypothetical protein
VQGAPGGSDEVIFVPRCRRRERRPKVGETRTKRILFRRFATLRVGPFDVAQGRVVRKLGCHRLPSSVLHFAGSPLCSSVPCGNGLDVLRDLRINFVTFVLTPVSFEITPHCSVLPKAKATQGM